jgi:hypothetical protein
MREKPSHIALFLLVAVLLAPSAFAHPLKPAHAASVKTVRTTTRSNARTARSTPVAAHLREKRSARAEARPGASRVAARHLPARETPVHPQRVLRLEQRRTALATQRKHRATASVEEARIPPEEQAPTPEPAPAELPPVEVHHNRKVHLTPDAAEPAPDATPRKATVQDFLDTPAVPAGHETSPAPKPSATAAKHPVSLVERKPTPLPVVKAASPIVPDPVAQPVLYTARGRLIVPPALKGSHEVLLHQNEMADRDGLIRVQDDADLERLRAAKELVALPASPALEIDERLPANRRYCRPWTAQFLAAIARAHYARFHTPLQVNSAVRTVEFQERLRTINGNAAPAEGETASPHLTGQAIDLAKHGLSMTEIAWMRGYLMPLVQQGKVDVEEEFQQACFHISVYKNYVPQPVPRREIPTRHAAATALATAIH